MQVLDQIPDVLPGGHYIIAPRRDETAIEELPHQIAYGLHKSVSGPKLEKVVTTHWIDACLAAGSLVDKDAPGLALIAEGDPVDRDSTPAVATGGRRKRVYQLPGLREKDRDIFYQIAEKMRFYDFAGSNIESFKKQLTEELADVSP